MLQREGGGKGSTTLERCGKGEGKNKTLQLLLFKIPQVKNNSRSTAIFLSNGVI